MKVRWLRVAATALDEEYDSLAERSPKAAKGVFAAFGAVDRLAEFPEVGRQGSVPGTRELVIPTTPYLIVYKVNAGVVEVLRVFHTARNWLLLMPDDTE